MGHIELSMLVYNPIFIKIVTDILRMTCLSCFRLQLSDNLLNVVALQLKLIDAGHVTQALDIEIFKSDVVASNDSQIEGESKLKEYEDLLEKEPLDTSVENTKNSEALRSSIVSTATRIGPIKRCIHCKEALKKVKYSFKKLMLTVTRTDLDASM